MLPVVRRGIIMDTERNRKMVGGLLIGFALILVFVLASVKTDLDVKDAYLCDITHSIPELNASECPVHKSAASWYIVVAFGVGFLILGSGLYMVFARKGRVDEKVFKDVDIGTLDVEERKVYDFLKGRQGSAYQGDLTKELGLSKVQVTRILDKMELKGVVERRRRGMANVVVLK